MGKKSKRKGRRGRFETAADAERQLREITDAQQQTRKREKPGIIERVDKSKQRVRNALGHIRGIDDADAEFP